MLCNMNYYYLCSDVLEASYKSIWFVFFKKHHFKRDRTNQTAIRMFQNYDMGARLVSICLGRWCAFEKLVTGMGAFSYPSCTVNSNIYT